MINKIPPHNLWNVQLAAKNELLKKE
jgi:hypothetical protein